MPFLRKYTSLKFAIVFVLWSCSSASNADSLRFTTVSATIEELFQGVVQLEQGTAWLSESQLQKAREIAGDDVAIDGLLVTYYKVSRAGESLATVFLDTHPVRSSTQTLMIVVEPRGRIMAVRLLHSGEVPGLMPRRAWLEQFRGQSLSGEKSLVKTVDGVSGATLTSLGVARAVRRALAVHWVIN